MSAPNQPVNKVRYLVLESRQRKPLLQELYEITSSPLWVYVFAETEWQPYLEESPVLVEAAQDSAEYRWALKGLKENRLSGLILESPKDLNTVANWLRARLTVRFDGQRKGLLRFYDPYIWHRLQPGTTAETEIIERAIYWHQVNGQERWLNIENPEPITMSPVPTLNEQQRLTLSASVATS